MGDCGLDTDSQKMNNIHHQLDFAQPCPGISAISAFSDNYIWLVSNGTQALVVDPGQAQPVLHWGSTLR